MIRPSPSVPMHLGVILDGNRRWARVQGLPTLEGHRKGYENLKTIALAARDRGVSYLSAYVFSTENWNRSQEEVAYLMNLLKWVLGHEVAILHKENIRVRFLGSRHGLSQTIQAAIDAAEDKTKDNVSGTLAFCLNYGGKQEIADACRRLVELGTAPEAITTKAIEQQLYAPDIPPVDLIIRTSGEQRLSNFMLWRAAYSELYFVDKHWPAFTADDLDLALAEYARRTRRFGK